MTDASPSYLNSLPFKHCPIGIDLDSNDFGLPALTMEYAEYGTLSDFQRETAILNFGIKKKIRISHDDLPTCNIVHSDLKHESVPAYYRTKTRMILYLLLQR